MASAIGISTSTNRQLLTRMAMESVSLCERMKSGRASLELESATRAATDGLARGPSQKKLLFYQNLLILRIFC
jgi:hypothetical protein